jgi:hypothetical protein
MPCLFFWGSLTYFLPGLALSHDSHTCTSQVAGITGVNHCAQLLFTFLMMSKKKMHYSSGKCKSKSQWGITSHLLGWLEAKQQKTRSAVEDGGKLEPCTLLGGMKSGTAIIENNVKVFQKIKVDLDSAIQQSHFWVFTENNWNQDLGY